MAVQQIDISQIANTGGVAGQVLVSNGTALTWGDANNTNFVGTVSAANVVSNAQLAANLGNYQTTAGLAANVATLTANNTSFVGTVTAANVVSNAQLTANLGNYQTTAGLSANVATLTANNTSFVGTVSAANVVSNSQLSGNLANYQTTAGLAANVAILSANNSSFLGGVAAASYVNTSGGYTLSGNITFNANLTIAATGEFIITNGAGIYANGGLGTSGQVLTSNGSAVYWSTVSGGGGGFTNGQSISVNNFVINGAFSANGSNGTSGQLLASNGSGVYWTTVAAATSATSQSFTGNGSNTVYTLAESISDQKNIIITLDGVVQIPSTHYSISGTTLTFTIAPLSNTTIEARTLAGGSGSSNTTVAMEQVFVGSFLLGGM